MRRSNHQTFWAKTSFCFNNKTTPSGNIDYCIKGYGSVHVSFSLFFDLAPRKSSQSKACRRIQLGVCHPVRGAVAETARMGKCEAAARAIRLANRSTHVTKT